MKIVLLILFLIPLLAHSQLTSLIVDGSGVLYNVNPLTGSKMRIIDPSQLKTNYTDSVGFGTTADSRLTVSNVNCLTCPLPQVGTLLHSISEGTVNGRTSMDSYNNGGAQGSIIQGRRGRGTANSPTFVLKDDILLALGGDGFGTSFHNISLGGMSVRAATDFSTQSSAPVYVVFSTTDSGSITPVQRAFLSMKGMWQWTAYGSGFMKSDVSGNLISSALTSGEISTALGYTPANAASATDTTSLSNRINTKQNTLSAGTGISIVNNVVTNTSPNQTVSFSNAGAVTISGSYPSFTSSFVPTISTPTRALNSNFTVSANKWAFVNYSDSLSATNPLLAGTSNADIYLEYSTNAGSSWVTISQNGLSSGVGLAVAIAITQKQKGLLAGWIPPAALVRLRSVVSGTASANLLQQQESVF